jgi:hypothetical protein
MECGCGASFLPKSTKSKFCSRKCQRRESKRRECEKKRKPAGWQLTHVPGQCSACDKHLPVPRHYTRRQCDHCKKYGTPVQRRANRRRNHKRRCAVDPGYVMRDRLSGRLRELCVKRGIQKSNSITVYLGCTPTELIAHIERQFTDGMTWDNYGVFGWHIDHHIPCAVFDLTREDHRHLCFHKDNLRPLWGTRNSEKRDLLQNDIPAALKARAFAIGILVL